MTEDQQMLLNGLKDFYRRVQPQNFFFPSSIVEWNKLSQGVKNP